MTGDILRLVLLALQLGFVALLYLVLFRFASSLVRDLRGAEQAQLASRTGIGRLTVLEMIISHDLGTARTVSDFIAVLWKGRIVESGPSDELFNSENPFVHQFLNAEIEGPLTMD